MFKPSQHTAERAAHSYRGTSPHLGSLPRLAVPGGVRFAAPATPAADAARPDAHSRHAPKPGSPIDPAQVREAMAEKLDRLLGSVGGWHGAVRPGSATLILTRQRRFEPEFGHALAFRLGLLATDAEALALLDDLAGELYDWVRDHPAEAKAVGLEVTADGDVVLVSVALVPVLPPLNK